LSSSKVQARSLGAAACHQTTAASRVVRSFYRVLLPKPSGSTWLRSEPACRLPARGSTTRHHDFGVSRARPAVLGHRRSPHELHRHFRDKPTIEPPTNLSGKPNRRESNASLEVLVPYSVFPVRGSGLSGRGCQYPPACASRFSQPPDAFIRPEPAGLVSCRYRSWGCTLQSITPLVQPYAVSGASYPQAVVPQHLCPTHAPLHRHQPRIKRQRRNTSHTDRREPLRSTTGSYSARESATDNGGLDRCTHVALLGFRPFRVFTLEETAWLSPRPPLTRLARTRARRTTNAPPQGIDLNEIGWSLSRLPTLLGFPTS
jgi:hypothetical protein